MHLPKKPESRLGKNMSITKYYYTVYSLSAVQKEKKSGKIQMLS